MASYVGLVPVPHDPGRVTGNLRRPKRYNLSLNRVCYTACPASKPAEPRAPCTATNAAND
ncbi:hypothetical protein H0B56_14520 [Haloechinothrix sp. YIM 98757]|uniref:Transposase n=1 Tax=Haloechinothrix aidingensis TaxID=2752311 RepID=A0A838AC07_9PSEU|nr:hypothetical protein [Haloechinothrix aidingensis]MBA0126761.1 hypothetical protein [Haloechinothrix aidingensis]